MNAMTPEAQEQERQRRQAVDKLRRWRKGVRPRSQSLMRRKPWESESISRRTWYRRRGTEDHNQEMNITGAVVPSPAAVSFVPPPIRSNQEADDIGAVPPVPASPGCSDPDPASFVIVVGDDPTTAAAPVVNDDPPPSPWSNDAVAWQRWFDRHPDELRKFLHEQQLPQ